MNTDFLICVVLVHFKFSLRATWSETFLAVVMIAVILSPSVIVFFRFEFYDVEVVCRMSPLLVLCTS